MTGSISRLLDCGFFNISDVYPVRGDRNLPEDNNLAERELRPLVIARKFSFGSKSEAS